MANNFGVFYICSVARWCLHLC